MNMCYLILNILFIIIFNIYFKEKGLLFKDKLVLTFSYLIFSLISFSYMNYIVNSIFSLRYLNVKVYLGILIISNLILLYTINRSIKLGYRICNYLLFMILMIVFGATLSVMLGNKFNTFYIMDVKNAVTFMDLSLVIFMIYLIVISLLYIGYFFFSKENIVLYFSNFDLVSFVSKCKFKLKKLYNRVCSFVKNKNKSRNNDFDSSDMLTPDELLSYDYESGFYINGVNASIIFFDSNKENIVKNYYILSRDIHAKLMNGYTLEENEMFKSICYKLNVSKLCYVDLNNINILEKISIDEYNLLLRVYGINY